MGVKLVTNKYIIHCNSFSQYILVTNTSSVPPDLDVLTSINKIDKTWREICRGTISHCFSHAGFKIDKKTNDEDILDEFIFRILKLTIQKFFNIAYNPNILVTDRQRSVPNFS